MTASPPVDPALRVTVKQTDSPFIEHVYVGLVPLDRLPGNPVREMITMTGRAELSAPPGIYGLTTAAKGFQPDFRNVRVVAGTGSDVIVELRRANRARGTVADSDGKPIEGARVRHIMAARSAVVADLSELAIRHMGKSIQTTTDAEGAWQLDASRLPLLVEADGFVPTWVTPRPPDDQQTINVTLQKGSSLRVVLDRIDPSFIVRAIPRAPHDKEGLPPQVQSRLWIREASARTFQWNGLPPGEYQIVASHPDPLRFMDPVQVGFVRLTAGSDSDIRVTLPPAFPAAKAAVSFLVPRKTDLSDLRAYVRAGEGVRLAKHATRDTLGGKVIFIETAVAPHEVYITTRTELLIVDPDWPKSGIDALEPMRIEKAAGKLRLLAGEGARLPSFASLSFQTCSGGQHIVLPVSISKDGVADFPLVVACEAFALSFDGLGTLGLPVAAKPGDEKWFGEYELTVSASAEVHAVFAGTNAASALIRAVEIRNRQKITVAEATAGEDGRAVLTSLPAGEIIFEARLADTKHVGTQTVTIEPGQQIVIDPLEVPEPASLFVSAALDPAFKNENPSATVFGLVIERDTTERPRDTRNVNFADETAEAAFDDLAPGRWRILAMVRLEDAAQRIDVDAVDLKAGDERRVDARVKPLLFSGQVVVANHGIRASVGIGDPPSPHAIRRDIQTTNDGRFKVALPRSGHYPVIVRVRGESIDLGQIAFNDGSPFVRLELPEASLAIRVRDGDSPVGGAVVQAWMRVDSADARGTTRLMRRGKTDPSGAVTFENLQPGAWTIEARQPSSGLSAEKVAVLARSGRADTTLDLRTGNRLEGVVIDHNGALAGGANVDCVFAGTTGVLQTLRGTTNEHGAFSIPLPDSVSSRLDCGVATTQGAIASFVTAPGDTVELALPQATGRLIIADWGEHLVPDRFWLVASDGRLFNLSWGARRFGQPWASMTIARVPAGRWKIVRADSMSALTAVARGLARSLPTAADVRIGEGETIDIRIQDGSEARR